MKTHTFAVDSPTISALQLGKQVGRKLVHVARDDSFDVGDIMLFEEQAPADQDPKRAFLGRKYQTSVADIARGTEGLSDGFVAIALRQ